jgi:ABC-type multidrug transport system ATPase subunit
MLPPPAICIQGLTVEYGKFIAVDQLDLEIRRGELFGLLGPNGAGKSTTLKVLIGQRRPTNGSVKILGHDVVREWSLIKPKFGYVPDKENHFDEFTGRRNLQIFAGLYDVPRTRIHECLKMVELDEAADLQVKRYSLGMRKKLLLARAILHRPEILYLDEPTANLDVYSASIVHRILRNMLADGSTIILTTHNMKEVQEICHRVAILCKGCLIALDTPLALRQQHHHRTADLICGDGSKLQLNLDRETDRNRLVELLHAGSVASMHTREFDFHDAFLKLTGQAFD